MYYLFQDSRKLWRFETLHGIWKTRTWGVEWTHCVESDLSWSLHGFCVRAHQILSIRLGDAWYCVSPSVTIPTSFLLSDSLSPRDQGFYISVHTETQACVQGQAFTVSEVTADQHAIQGTMTE